MLSLEDTRSFKPRTHFPGDILRIRQFSCHAPLIRRIDAPDIFQFFGCRAVLFHFIRRQKHLFCRQFTSLERRDHIGNARDKARRRVLCRALIDRQLILFFLNKRAENHALSAFIKKGSFRQSCQFKHTRLQPFRRQYVDQE